MGSFLVLGPNTRVIKISNRRINTDGIHKINSLLRQNEAVKGIIGHYNGCLSPGQAEKILMRRSTDKIIDVIGKIRKKCDRFAPLALKVFPTALEKAKKRLTADHIIDLFGKIIGECPECAPWTDRPLSFDERYAIVGASLNTIPAAIDAKLYNDQIVWLFKDIVKCTNALDIFNILPAAFKKTKKILSAGKMFSVFEQIITKTHYSPLNAFQVFSTLSLSGLFDANLNPEQISDRILKTFDD